MKPGRRGRQLISVADIARSSREVLKGLDDGSLSPTAGRAKIEALRLIYDTMRFDTKDAFILPNSTGQSANR